MERLLFGFGCASVLDVLYQFSESCISEARFLLVQVGGMDISSQSFVFFRPPFFRKLSTVPQPSPFKPLLNYSSLF